MDNYIDYYFDKCVHDVTWRGVKANKFVMDAWIYQEIVHKIRPNIIIEIGNSYGGSTLFLADIQKLVCKGKVIGIDTDQSMINMKVRNNPNILLIPENAADAIDIVKSIISKNDHVMIIEDSSHTFDNTLAILETYHKIVSPGSYFIVEDGICARPGINGPKPGPFEAIHCFLKTHSNYVIDNKQEKFYLTANPDGYLLKLY